MTSTLTLTLVDLAEARWTAVLSAAVVVFVLMAGTALAARRTGRWAVVDVTWGMGFALVAVVTAVLYFLVDHQDFASHQLSTVPAELASGHRAPAVVHLYSTVSEPLLTVRPYALAVMVVVWGLRLASHIFRRGRGHGEDPRYEELKQRNPSFARAVLLPQGLAIWFVSLPVQLGMFGTSDPGWLMVAGILVWAVGLLFESVGDAQLARYKRDPDRGPVMDKGLWRYTRHPNYFGDACVWWGIWLVAADGGWWGVATIVSPIAMTYFLMFATGARLLERSMMQRDGYPEYAARTSMFFPLPPRRSS